MLASLVLNSWPCDPPASAFQSAGIIGMSHHASLKHIFLMRMDAWLLLASVYPVSYGAETQVARIDSSS